MNRLLFAMVFAVLGFLSTMAQTDSLLSDSAGVSSVVVGSDSLVPEMDISQVVSDDEMEALEEMATLETGLHQQLKTKFVEGKTEFMSLVAIALVLGLAFCIERIIYLTLSEIKTRRLMEDIDRHIEQGDLEGAKSLCRNTRGPVASVCYQGLLHAGEDMETVERNIVSYGSLQAARLERGCSWIRLFIAIAPSLGFLGTVIGMVMAFDNIQEAGDISPRIVAEGMKVALITTIFGIIVALVLQVFYNFIIAKIDHLTEQMEEAAITLMDILSKRGVKGELKGS
ncbi:MAG: MotA/TolQ/ExbB proton channel family protein [Prevotella sp.]|nr:MotA/TolQ/ExbB proton channel family protein [Prevotella sp.]